MQVALELPTAILTVLLGVCLVYWGFVFLGALDIDVLGGGDLEGVAKGAAEGAAKGLLEGASEAAPSLHGSDAAAGVGGMLEQRRRPRAPVTVTVSVHIALAWLVCALAMEALEGVLPAAGLGRAAAGLGVLVVAILVAWPASALVVAPLAPLFTPRRARSHHELVGRVCTITSGAADRRYGQAELPDGGAGLVLHVRCDAEGGLARGDQALIVGWDDERESFLVEPMRNVLGPGNGG